MMIKLAGPLTVAEVLRLSEATACPSQRLINRFVDRFVIPLVILFYMDGIIVQV